MVVQTNVREGGVEKDTRCHECLIPRLLQLLMGALVTGQEVLVTTKQDLSHLGYLPVGCHSETAPHPQRYQDASQATVEAVGGRTW